MKQTLTTPMDTLRSKEKKKAKKSIVRRSRHSGAQLRAQACTHAGTHAYMHAHTHTPVRPHPCTRARPHSSTRART
eukprot:6184818-Pleurochrysis_carterae.AAC.1